MYISFTGHRDKLALQIDLENLLVEFPNAIWVHGGAIGFDSQVERFARSHNVSTEVILPDYDTYGRKAPLIRNLEIVKKGELLIALFDGRKSGGTYFTINKAKEIGKMVRIISPISR